MRFPRIRTLLLLACAIGFVFWLRYGQQILSGQHRDHSQAIIAQYQSDVARRHPETPNWLAQQQDLYGERALAASIRSQSGVLADFETRQLLIRNSARLISLYERDPLRDEAILWSHGTALQIAGDDTQLSEELLRRLELAQAQPELWTLVRDNPVALTSDLLLESQQHRDFYAAHQPWIEDLVTALMQSVDVEAADVEAIDADVTNANVSERASGTGGNPKPAAIRLDAVLDLAQQSHPHLKTAIPDPQDQPSQSAVIFLTFLEHRELLAAVAGAGVPAVEAVEVLLLNADSLQRSDDASQGHGGAAADKAAAKLVRLYREKKVIWDQARREPLLLQFDQMVPAYSQRLIERFPQHGIPALIVTQYAEAPVAAAAAIDRYGELGIAVLVHYADSPRFVQLLGRGDRGFQTTMVVAMQSDAGLEKLAADPRYLDKLITEDGDPRQADWWQAVPVAGGIANVARNYATGRPNDWSEIGWATWDVVDAVLIVGSLGASKLVTEAGKQGIKASARGAGRRAAMQASPRAPAVGGAAAAAPTALQRLTRVAGRGAAGETAGAAARAGLVSATLRIGGRVVSLASRPLLAVSGRAYQASRVVLHAAAGAPPLVRLWVTRGLLGISLLARTPAMVSSVATGIANFTAEAVEQIAKQVEAVKQLVGLPAVADSLFGRVVNRIAYFGVLTALGMLAWMASFYRPAPRPRYQ